MQKGVFNDFFYIKKIMGKFCKFTVTALHFNVDFISVANFNLQFQKLLHL